MSKKKDDPLLQNYIDPDAEDSELTKLPDEDPPMNDPDDVPKQLDDTHPSTDSNIEPSEEYDEGLSGAAEAEEPRS